MVSLVLTILCSSSIALILKHNDSKAGNALALLAGNYFIAAIVGFVLWITQPRPEFSAAAAFFGVVMGALFVFSFFSFAKSVNAAGTALATVSSRLSVVISTFLSILFFGETPGMYQLAGYFFALLTLYFFYLSLRESHGNSIKFSGYFYLTALTVGIGINDFSLKLFSVRRPESEKELFLFFIFLSAFLYTSSILWFKKIKLDSAVLWRGTILGVPNILSSFFMINALLVLPATVVYPLSNIGIIVLTLLAAYLIWKEKLNRQGILALLSGTVAIVLIGL